MINVKENKILVVSSNYPYSLNEERRADIVVTIWFGTYTSDDETCSVTGYTSVPPYFTIKKNRCGIADVNLQIPLEFLPKFLKNPSGKLEWI